MKNEGDEGMNLTAREIELLDGMIKVHGRHAQRCDYLMNHTMAEKQKTWDLERVALLEKIKAWGTKTNDNPYDFKPL